MLASSSTTTIVPLSVLTIPALGVDAPGRFAPAHLSGSPSQATAPAPARCSPRLIGARGSLTRSLCRPECSENVRASFASGDLVGPDHVGQPPTARLHGARLARAVDGDDAEAHPVAERPLEVVEQ